jgi:CCR4-NOT transcription complex subunit 9
MLQRQHSPRAEASWVHQKTQRQHARQAAATSVAQHQHRNRIAATHNSIVPPLSAAHGQDANMMDDGTEENRCTLAFLADLLNVDTREAALLELSKKCEGVPELALILWHSFGMC